MIGKKWTHFNNSYWFLITWQFFLKSKDQLKVMMKIMMQMLSSCVKSLVSGFTDLPPFNIMKMTLQFTMLLMLCASFCSADLLAYDCAHQFANRTKINMLSTAPCNIKADTETVETKMIYLVQPKEFFQVHVRSCKVSIIRDINDCSTFSDNRVTGGLLSYIHEISVDECRNMHRFLNTKFYGNIISGLLPNNTVSTSLTLAGKIYHHDGGCKGGTWSENGVTWEDVYVSASVSITLKDYMAQSASDGTFVKLQSGYDCKLSDQKCIDPEDGHTFWEDNYRDKTCENDNYELIYKGVANKTTLQLANENSVLFSVSDEISFSLLIKSSTHVCGQLAYQTEHPKLKIIEHNGYDMPFKKVDDTFNLNLFTYINSKFTYLERHTKTQLTSLHKALLTNQCELDKSILNTQLALAFLSPADFAYLRMGMPGYTALPAGEVMYLVKCQAVSVKRKFSENCYQEFPVEYMNSTWYMAPRTHILLVRGNEVPCSEIVPINYNIDNKWYSFSPKAHETVEPTSIVPNSESGWKYSNPAPLISSGLYSSDDLEAIRRQLMFPLDKGAAVNAISNRIFTQRKSGENDDFDFSKLISENDVKTSVEGFFLKTTGILSVFGSYTSIVIGAWMVYTFSKWLLNLIFHFIKLYKNYGFDFRLSAAFWNSMSTHLIHKKTFDSHSENVSKMQQEISVLKDNSLTLDEKYRKRSHPLHVRYMYLIPNNPRDLEFYFCVPSKNDVEEIDGGILLKQPNENKTIRIHTMLGVYPCACVNDFYEENSTCYKPHISSEATEEGKRLGYKYWKTFPTLE